MRRILVTGGAGFIGSNFIRYILAAESQVKIINVDILTYAGSVDNLDNLPSLERYRFVEGDICDQQLIEDLLREEEIGTIINFAAETHVDRSIHSPSEFIRTNIVGTFSLLEAARTVWLEKKSHTQTNLRFHHVSTDEVFGSLETDSPAFSELTPYAPKSPYSASKASSDHLVRAYHHTFGLPVTISNCSNNYGPFQHPEKLIPLIIWNALEGKPLPVYGDGKQIRDWLFVADHCEAIWLIVQKGAPGQSYNIGGNNQPTNLEVVETVCEILDEVSPLAGNQSRKDLIRFVEDRPGHDRRYAMDITKINHDLDWYPRHSLHTGLIQTIEWYLSNKAWLAKVRNRPSYQEWIAKNYTQREAIGK